MPFYEFECARGHHRELLVPMGTKEVACGSCMELAQTEAENLAAKTACKRILSPTPTTFVCAGGRKL